MLIGSWSIVFGQVTDSLPVNGFLPKSTSATPSPSLPGSHDATSASISLSCAGSMIIGRPETTRTTQVDTAWQTLSIAALSAAENFMSFGGRNTPWSLGSKPHCGPPTSPKPSEYGVSPTTTTPTSLPATGADASALKVTLGATWRMPSRIVVPGMVLPDSPCQVMVQPPAWLPMLLAL